MERLIMVAACIATGWLYFAGVFAAGLIVHSTFSWQAALAGMGLSYFSYLLQGRGAGGAMIDHITGVLFLMTILFGAAAGICLVVG